MSPAVARARRATLISLLALALVAPVLLAAARWPSYWEWVAPELTPMTWLQTVLLFLAAAACLLIVLLASLHGHGRADRATWWFLAAGFGYLAIDDRFALHERVRDSVLAPRGIGIPGMSWLAPGDIQMVLMGLVGLALLPVILRAFGSDRAARTLLLLGGVAAACSIGIDTIDPASLTVTAERLQQSLEECVELLAVCLLLAATSFRLLGLLDSVGSDQPAQAVETGEPVEAMSG